MCNICLKNPCDARCPNAEMPKSVMTCSECGCGIFADDKYFDGGDKIICEECVEKMPVAELLLMLGEELRTA